jgi:hypothetical protein
VSHPSLGLPPRDLGVGLPGAASAIQSNRGRIAARALEVALDRDLSFRGRYSDLALRELLADTEAMAGRLATAVASGDGSVLSSWAEQVAPRYRKRSVPLDDVIGLAEGLRAAANAAVQPDARATIDASVDAAIAVLRWHRRLAGDARKKNPFIEFIYKGA